MSAGSDPWSAFIDDLIVVILGKMATADTMALLAQIEAWEPWDGVSVNLTKIRLRPLRLRQKLQSFEDILYQVLFLLEWQPDKPSRYLGMLLIFTLDYRFVKDGFRKTRKRRVAILANADVLSLSQRE